MRELTRESLQGWKIDPGCAFTMELLALYTNGKFCIARCRQIIGAALNRRHLKDTISSPHNHAFTSVSHTAPAISAIFCPPKPKLLVRMVRTFFSRAAFGM